MDLGRDGDIRYKAAINDPGVFKLTKTMLREDPNEKVVRVLRSWKLRSKSAPKAGLRYDGLYRIFSFSVHLSPPNTWYTAFTLTRLKTQPSLLFALHIPTSDQLDDWKDYQRLKLIDRGDDFAILREMLAQPGEGEETSEGRGMNDVRHGSEDSGYFSRRSSKTVVTGGGSRDSIFLEDVNDTVGGIEREEGKNGDDRAEEADDEGAGLEDLEEEEEYKYDRRGRESPPVTDDEAHTQKDSIAQPTHQPLTPGHGSQTHPQTRIIGTRFISPRRPAEPQLSADEATVARAKHPGAGKSMDGSMA